MNRRTFVNYAAGAFVVFSRGVRGRSLGAAWFGGGIADDCISTSSAGHDGAAANSMELSPTFSAAKLAVHELRTRKQSQQPVHTNTSYQIRSNSIPWDKDRWRPWLVQVRKRDVSHLIGYNATRSGNVQLTSAQDVEPRKVPFGFIGTGDSLHWDISVTKEGDYSVAVLYHSGETDNIGSEIIVDNRITSVRGLVLPVKTGTWNGGPQDRPSFRRIWLTGTLRTC